MEARVWRMAAAVDVVDEIEDSLLQAYTAAVRAHSEYLVAGFRAGSANVSDSDLVRAQRTMMEIQNRRKCLTAVMRRPKECDAVYNFDVIAGPGPYKAARRAYSRALSTPAKAIPPKSLRPMGFWALGSGTEEEKNVIEAGTVICERRKFCLFREVDASMQRFVGRAYVDPQGLMTLTKAQEEARVEWERASKLSGASMVVDGLDVRRIKQGFSLVNCSVIASFITCMNWEARFGTRLVTRNIFPQDSLGNPVLSPSGRYAVRLFLNGAPRLVEVDDFLPRLPTSLKRNSPIDQLIGVPLACASVVGQEAQNLWMPLIEKAIVKAGGQGYDTPGSTTSIDMLWLTGWIPEAWELGDARDETPDRMHTMKQIWESLYRGLAEGDAVFSTGPEDIGEEAAGRTGLHHGHAYAITDAFESSEGLKLVKLQNPWNKGSWRGPYSPTDAASWTPELLSEVGMVDCGVPPWVQREADDGTFWIPWEYIKWRFMSIHVNWNPAIYPFSASVHGSYPKRIPDVEHLRHNPQYLLEIGEGEGGEILLVLQRHYKDDTFSVKDPLSMALHVYEGTGRVYSKEGVLHQCTYRNSPFNSFRVGAPSEGKSSTYVLCVGLWFDTGDLNFTISAFSSTRQITLSKAPPAPGFPVAPPAGSLVSSISLWRKETSGGSVTCTDSYHKNPQFAIRVQKSGEVMIALELLPPSEKENSDISGEGEKEEGDRADEVGFEVVRGNGARVTAFNAPALMVDGGGEYKRCLTTGVFNLGEGVTYTVVASSKQGGRIGKFELSAQAKNGQGVQLAQLPEGTSHNPISGEAPWVSSFSTSALIDVADAGSGEIVEVSSVSSYGGVDLVYSDDDAADALLGGVAVAGGSASLVVGSTDAAMLAAQGPANPRSGGRARKRGMQIGGVTGPSPGSSVNVGRDADGVLRMSPAPQSPASPSDHTGQMSGKPPKDVLLF